MGCYVYDQGPARQHQVSSSTADVAAACHMACVGHGDAAELVVGSPGNMVAVQLLCVCLQTSHGRASAALCMPTDGPASSFVSELLSYFSSAVPPAYPRTHPRMLRCAKTDVVLKLAGTTMTSQSCHHATTSWYAELQQLLGSSSLLKHLQQQQQQQQPCSICLRPVLALQRCSACTAALHTGGQSQNAAVALLQVMA
jgi:hypothetical protein